MTFKDFIKCGEINSKLSTYQNKKRKAIEICIEMLKTHDKPYVALSGGKDSVAMAFIVAEASNLTQKDFVIWSHISDASFPGTLETCQEVSKRLGKTLDIYKSEQSAFDTLTDNKKQAFGKTGVFFNSIREYAKTKDLAFVGVRAYESKRRMTAAKYHGSSFYSKSMGDIDVCNPLQWFTIYDIASVLYEYKAPIHPIYYKKAVDIGKNANGEPIFIRLSYITSKDLWDKGTLNFVKINYPEIYAKLISICPDIKRYT